MCKRLFCQPEEVVVNGGSNDGQLCDQVHAVLKGGLPVLALVHALKHIKIITLEVRKGDCLKLVGTCS